MDNTKLGELVLRKDRRALARAITLVENQSPMTHDILNQIFPFTGKAHIIGVTGPPGSGKSTLVDKVIKELRENEFTVGVIAVDPTSPFSGGAILGDRIRMLQFTEDKDVFIRSMASRGRLGGLAPSTFSCIALMDAFGFDKIIVETVGIGQSEIDIIQNSDTTVVISVPGLGDDIQVIKAGIMEIADIFLVHKSDLPGADRLAEYIKQMMNLIPKEQIWTPPLQKTNALNGEGIEEFCDHIENHWRYLKETDELSFLRRKRISYEVKLRLEEIVLQKLEFESENSIFENAVNQIINHSITPIEAAKELYDALKD
ncbi:MAG: methylmalonyl Co-A mutase-associated GTPase MeaB [Candidatus Kariarchaeaceae archaeon]|jgi:LAO/AO transport system kinase